jgi:hypothetical protein
MHQESKTIKDQDMGIISRSQSVPPPAAFVHVAAVQISVVEAIE